MARTPKQCSSCGGIGGKGHECPSNYVSPADRIAELIEEERAQYQELVDAASVFATKYICDDSDLRRLTNAVKPFLPPSSISDRIRELAGIVGNSEYATAELKSKALEALADEVEALENKVKDTD